MNRLKCLYLVWISCFFNSSKFFHLKRKTKSQDKVTPQNNRIFAVEKQKVKSGVETDGESRKRLIRRWEVRPFTLKNCRLRCFAWDWGELTEVWGSSVDTREFTRTVLRARLGRAFRSVSFARVRSKIHAYGFSRYVCSNLKFKVQELTVLKSFFYDRCVYSNALQSLLNKYKLKDNIEQKYLHYNFALRSAFASAFRITD